MIPLAAFSLPLASPGLADGQGFSAALRCNPSFKERDITRKRKATAAKPKPAKKRTKPARLPRKDRSRKTTERLDWQGIRIAVSYEPDWLNMSSSMPEAERAHLEVRRVSPAWAQLPITETGYHSQFVLSGTVERAGGPAAYVRAWLDEAAKSPAWKRREFQSRQLSLF